MKASSVIASFLSGHGGGVYTTMRTVCRSSKIFAYRDHVKRLALVREAIDPSIKDGFDEEATTRLVTPHVRSAILQRLAEKVSGELRISVALRLRDECKTARDATLNDVEVFVAVEELLEARESAVAIEAAVAHRDNPTVKHGAWIEQRKDLEARMRKECNEVIMTDEKGLVTEGLSSNVVFVDNAVGCVVTAPSDLVLTGTILQLLLTICEEDKIPVKRECPKLSDFAKGGVLITSTSRLALPVRQIFMPDGESVQLQTRSHIMDQLVEKVRQRIENASVQIL